MSTIHRAAAIAIIASALAVVTGCNDGWSPDASPVGLFSLLTVDGRPLPLQVAGPDGMNEELTRAQIAFASDLTCTGTFTLREGSGTRTQFRYCNWEHTGTELRIQWQEGPDEAGSLKGNSLSLESAGALWVLERRRSRGLAGGSGSQGSH
jgi:hypothetical protein